MSALEVAEKLCVVAAYVVVALCLKMYMYEECALHVNSSRFRHTFGFCTLQVSAAALVAGSPSRLCIAMFTAVGTNAHTVHNGHELERKRSSAYQLGRCAGVCGRQCGHAHTVQEEVLPTAVSLSVARGVIGQAAGRPHLPQHPQQMEDEPPSELPSLNPMHEQSYHTSFLPTQTTQPKVGLCVDTAERHSSPPTRHHQTMNALSRRGMWCEMPSPMLLAGSMAKARVHATEAVAHC